MLSRALSGQGDDVELAVAVLEVVRVGGHRPRKAPPPPRVDQGPGESVAEFRWRQCGEQQAYRHECAKVGQRNIATLGTLLATEYRFHHAGRTEEGDEVAAYIADWWNVSVTAAPHPIHATRSAESILGGSE